MRTGSESAVAWTRTVAPATGPSAARTKPDNVVGEVNWLAVSVGVGSVWCCLGKHQRHQRHMDQEQETYNTKDCNDAFHNPMQYLLL